MSDVIQFVPRAGRDARESLDEFIRLARDDLTAFGVDSWPHDRWKQGKTVAVFATQLQELTPYRYTPLAQPFKDFAKAYIRYKYSHMPVVSVQYWLQALRCVEAALVHSRSKADVLLLNGVVMDLSAQKCREFYASEDVYHKTGLALVAVFDFCRDKFASLGLPQWRSPFKKPTILTEDLGEAGREHREGKMPSNASMLALADFFAGATSTHTRFYSSIAILLMATPSRISEVLSLPVGCIGREPDDSGVDRMCLRWVAAKGKGGMKKWVLPVMEDVVVEAVNRLEEIGRSARAAARFAFENPGVYMRSAECSSVEQVGDDAHLSPKELFAALNLDQGSAKERGVPASKRLQQFIQRGDVTYRDLARFVKQEYEGDDWPFINTKKVVRVWDALCLHRECEFHSDFEPKSFSWRLPTANEVNARLNPEKGVYLLAGLKEADGTRIKLTTHQPRHWLSTMSERAGMDDFTLAQWAGRAKPTDNRHYDHRSPEERLSEARALIVGDSPGLLERFKNRQPVTYQELGVDRLGTAKATLYGMCTHDYAMAPCMKQRDCMTCKEHRCIKGDHVTLDRIRLLEAQTQILLEKAQQAHVDGDFGADRWVDNHKWKLAHTRTMRILLEEESLPDGAVLRIPDGHDPSPVQRALMDLGLIEPPSGTLDATSIPLRVV